MKAQASNPLVTGNSRRPTQLREVGLDKFFAPKTVAIIGASDARARPNTVMTRKLKKWAERAGATVYLVNPTRDTVDGEVCLDTIFQIPGEIDLAVILTGNPLPSYAQVVERGASFAVIFAAGFAETGKKGERLQGALAEMVHGDGGVRLLGPNTNLNAFEMFREDLPGKRIALITQSGHQGRPIFQGQELGIPMSHWAPTGNEVDLEFADFAAYFAAQPSTGAIAAYIEGFKDGRTLMLAADAAARAGVPIVMVKVGRTQAGRSMAKAHTGHLTGSDAVASAVFRQFGITRVDGLDELLDTSAMFARCTAPAKSSSPRGVAIYSISGGSGAHMADVCESAGLELPELTTRTKSTLRELIPGYLRVSNPIDCGGPPVMDSRGLKILEAIVADPRIGVVICPITGALDSLSIPLARDLVEIARTTDKPICVVWGSPVGNESAYRDILLQSQLPVFRTYRNCANAVRSWQDKNNFTRRYKSPFYDPTASVLATPGRGARKVRSILSNTPAGETLSELASKQILAAYGIKTSRDVLCGSAASAVGAATEIGFPVVMKACSSELVHKTELGLVRTGITSAAEVRRIFDDLVAKAAKAGVKKGLEGILVCESVTGGVEVVIGIAQDPLFGPTVMVGLGGVLVEVLGDVSFRVPPFDADEALRMVQELRGFPLLQGARGSKPADLGALVDVIMKIQHLAVDCEAVLGELDINPLIVKPRGAIALDALVVTARDSRSR